MLIQECKILRDQESFRTNHQSKFFKVGIQLGGPQENDMALVVEASGTRSSLGKLESKFRFATSWSALV